MLVGQASCIYQIKRLYGIFVEEFKLSNIYIYIYIYIYTVQKINCYIVLLLQSFKTQIC